MLGECIHVCNAFLTVLATESEISRSSAVSSKDSKKAKDKPKTPTKSGDLNVEESFDNGFKTSQSTFLPDIKTGIDEY